LNYTRVEFRTEAIPQAQGRL